LYQFPPIKRRRPVHAGIVPVEQLAPVGGRPCGYGSPHFLLFGVQENLSHVVTRAEAERRQSLAHRICASSAETGSHHFQRQIPPPMGRIHRFRISPSKRYPRRFGENGLGSYSDASVPLMSVG